MNWERKAKTEIDTKTTLTDDSLRFENLSALVRMFMLIDDVSFQILKSMRIG